RDEPLAVLELRGAHRPRLRARRLPQGAAPVHDHGRRRHRGLGQRHAVHAAVRDDLAGVVIPDVPVSSRSVWDQHLEARGLVPEFTLNSINYDAAADLLIPRAVGYVTGLLDAFFRARLDGHIQIASGSEGLQARLEF